MKKIFVSIVLIGVLMVTGCTSSKETKEKQEEITVVYCSDCGDESSEITKFCPGCGVEAKWTSEKSEDKKEEVVEEINNENKENIKKESTTINKKEKKSNFIKCDICGGNFKTDTINKLDSYNLCNVCYDNPKTCEYGFEDICEGCSQCNKGVTYEEAYELAKQYWKLDNATASESIYGDSTPQWANGGYYYTFWLRDPEMMAAGGTGTVSTIKVYSNGYIYEI